MQTKPLVIEYVAITSLHLNPANPRRISEQDSLALDRSVEAWSLVDPLIARASDRVVISGNQRLRSALRAGLETVPVIFVDISLEESSVLGLALNKINGAWDEDLLARLLAELQQIPNLDLSLSGFDDDEVAKLIKRLDVREKRDRVETFDFDTELEAASATCSVQLGETWKLGDHLLRCGDATDAEQVKELVGNTPASMGFKDPPYNVDLGNHGGAARRGRKRRIANDALPAAEWENFVRGWAANVVKNVDGPLYICMSSKEWPLVSNVLADSGAHWSDTIIWAKDRFVLGRADYQRQYEPIWYGWREGCEHFWCGDRDQGNVWTIPRPASSELHPTMKPVELVQRAIENSSRVGDRVLDLFLGSGTTLIAAERTGRTCLGMEIDPRYCHVAIKRWEAFSGSTAVKVSG